MSKRNKKNNKKYKRNHKKRNSSNFYNDIENKLDTLFFNGFMYILYKYGFYMDGEKDIYVSLYKDFLFRYGNRLIELIFKESKEDKNYFNILNVYVTQYLKEMKLL